MTRALALSFALLLPCLAAAQETIPTLPLTARGNEPFWTVTLTTEALRLIEPDGKGSALDYPYSASASADGITTYRTDSVALRIDPALCRDDMTGMPHPFTATLLRDGAEYPGCAGDPARLLAGTWQGTFLATTPLPADSAVTLTFEAGQISGQSGCNHFSGGYMLTGEGLTFTPLATTRMACPASQMATENAVLDALAHTARFDIDSDGALVLLDASDTPRLTAARP